MNRRKLIIFAIAAAVILGCIGGVILLTTLSGDDSGASEPTGESIPSLTPESSDATTVPTVPSQPNEVTLPTRPSDPTHPADPSNPVAPSNPTEPDVPVADTDQSRETKISVTFEDGTPASGAAVIATHSSGHQAYAPTDENGTAVLQLPEGQHSIRVFRDGQRGNAEIEIGDEPVEIKISLKDARTLYVLLGAAGSYQGDPNALAYYSTLEKAIKSQYPHAVYLTAENRYDAKYLDGDALLAVEVFVENYASSDLYFPSEIRIDFTTYQECIAVWDKDEGTVETEYAEGNVCRIKVRNEYDYEYKNGAGMISEAYYWVQKDWHLRKYADWADSWGYGYTTDIVLSTGTEHRIKAPGGGMEEEAYRLDLTETRFRDYLTYTQQLFPYVDLWMSGKWNGEIEQLAAAQ